MKLHFGCGTRKFDGWTNTDAEVNLLARLPWSSGSCECALGQHVIEHLTLQQGLSLAAELRRVVRPGGWLVLSCPDMEKICREYLGGHCKDLLKGKRRRYRDGGFHYSQAVQWGGQVHEPPAQAVMTAFFIQSGEHRFLYDLELLTWMLRLAHWSSVQRIKEADLLAMDDAIQPRHDDDHALYVLAR